MAQSLADHTSQHRLQSFAIAIRMFPHALKYNTDTHLATSYGSSRVEKIQVGQLAVDAIVDDMKGLKAMIESIVYYDHALQRAAFHW